MTRYLGDPTSHGHRLPSQIPQALAGTFTVTAERLRQRQHRLHRHRPLHQQRPPGRPARRLHLHRRRPGRPHLQRHAQDGRHAVASPPPTRAERHHRLRDRHHGQPGGGQHVHPHRLPVAHQRRHRRQLHCHGHATPTATWPPATSARSTSPAPTAAPRCPATTPSPPPTPACIPSAPRSIRPARSR